MLRFITSFPYEVICPPGVISRKYILFFVWMIITGCTERKIREESYNIPYRLRDSAQQYTADFVTDEMTFGSVRRTKYSGSSRHRTFANTDIEIEMQKWI